MRLLPLLPPPRAGALFLGWLPMLLSAAPYRPTDEAMVLERLPAGAVSGRLNAATATATATDAATAVVLARAWIARARQDADPRFLGYAEGALAPWWDAADAPIEIALLRATLLQSRHRFDDALAGIDELLRRAPGNAQAVLTQATILRVQGRFEESASACERLASIAPGVPAQVCAASVSGLRGQLGVAADDLARILPSATAQPAPIQLWYFAERADLAVRAGQPEQALQLYRMALQQTGGDAGLRAAIADILLDLGRPDEVAATVGEDANSELLLLRVAIAARDLGTPRPELEARLADAYAAARRRGDSPHLREEARFALEIQFDSIRALALAQENWKQQREPADALILAQAAVAAKRPAAIGALLQWLQATSSQDARIDAVLAQVRS